MRPRTLIRYVVSCTYRPRHLLSQHLPTWDEWSSPSELIHPGDWAEHFECHEQPDEICLQVGFATVSAQLDETWQPVCRGGGTVRIGKRSTAHRVAAKGCGRQHHIDRFASRSLSEQTPSAAALRNDDC
jgi:hypothetical protein